MRTVLLFRTSYWLRNNGQSYKQIFDFASTHDWQLQCIEYVNATTSALWHDAPAPKPKVRELIEIWRPDGCIVEAGGIPNEPWQAEFGTVPVVYIDRPVEKLARHEACLSSDDQALAQTAAKELLRLQLDHFAYASTTKDRLWNQRRLKAFRHIIEQHGKRFTTFPVSETDPTVSPTDGLCQVLHALPKPCGVFAANDSIGARVISSCHKAGISVPDDIAVIGVDNNAEICEHLPVTLTSIEQERTNSGLEAAEMLEALMTTGRIRNRIRYFKISRVVRRASANGLRDIDHRVATALELIRANACSQLTPTDVCSAMGCSSRHALRLFLSIRGHSILHEIHLQRIEIAKAHLRDASSTIEAIAHSCGFASISDFGRVFKRYTGSPPRAWKG